MTATVPLRALVVEDDVLVREATKRALNQEGFICEVAADGTQALERLRERKFDVAISDLRMPEMNGHRVIVEMLAMEDRPAIIVLTGVTEPRLVRDLFARGVDDVMAKPANYDVLVLKARALAQRRRPPETGGVGEMELEQGMSSPTALSDDKSAANKKLLAECEHITDQIRAICRGLEAPPVDYDGFRVVSGAAFGMKELTEAIQVRPLLAGEVLMFANSLLFRSSERCSATIESPL